jgi:hypothetical protein
MFHPDETHPVAARSVGNPAGSMPCAYISRIRRLAAAGRPPVLDSAESGIADYAFEILAQLKKSVRHRDRRRWWLLGLCQHVASADDADSSVTRSADRRG